MLQLRCEEERGSSNEEEEEPWHCGVVVVPSRSPVAGVGVFFVIPALVLAAAEADVVTAAFASSSIGDMVKK